ncbi:MAG: hypothetical protein J7K87_02265 [Candidatus Aenigmarchaeota archaeon]|nr:hypothetical protein [Candidatus Aenigmarchaeota archaeon]
MNKKGQNITVEQMFLFTIGLVITIIIYFSFNLIGNNIEKVSKEDQINEVEEFVKSCIVRSYLGPNGTLVYDVPKKISEKPYMVVINNGIIKIVYEGDSFNTTINKYYNARGRFFSSYGKFKVEKVNNNIVVGR